MDISQLHLSDPLEGMASDGAVTLGDLYDDFVKHAGGAVETRLQPVR